MLLELLCSFSFEKLFYNKNWFIFWYLRHCNIESLPEKIFSNIFINILSPGLSNYDLWNSLFVCQFLNYLINKTIVLINQQLVNFYENNNLKLFGRQKFFKKLDLRGATFFETPYREHLRWLLLKVDMVTASYLCMFLFGFFFKSMKLCSLLILKLKPVGIFLLEVNNGNTKNNVWNLCNVNNNDTRTMSTAISPEIIREPRKPLVFWWFKGNRNWLCSVILLLILNRFQKLFWCFHSWLWTNNYQLGTYLRKSGKGWGADLWMTWLNRSWKLQCSALYLLELPWNEKK